jgi:hypothetical protein
MRTKVWFAASGLVRLLLAGATLVLTFYATSRLSLTMIGLAALAAVGVYAISAFMLAPLLQAAASSNRLRVLVGRGPRAAAAFTGLAYAAFFAFFLGAPLLIFTAPAAVDWIGERGGAGSIYLTLSLVCVGLLCLSALARLLWIPLALWEVSRERLQASGFATGWESAEATALLCGLYFCAPMR